MATVRYIVDDVDASVAFYTVMLGFTVVQQFGPAMAIVERGDVSLWIAGPLASASKAMPDGRKPMPGGWNRLVLEATDLTALVADLVGRGARFRNDIVDGPSGRQITILWTGLVDDRFCVKIRRAISWSCSSPGCKIGA